MNNMETQTEQKIEEDRTKWLKDCEKRFKEQWNKKEVKE